MEEDDDTAGGYHGDLIPHRFRNCINPWQTPKEIRNAVKYMTKLVQGLDEEEARKITMEDLPDRKW